MVTILKIKDIYLIKNHYALLSNEDLRYRFNISVSEHSINSFCNTLNFEHDIHIGIIENNVIVGLLHAIKTDNRMAEVAISVLKEYRKLGYSDRLWHQVVKISPLYNIEHLNVFYSSENKSMLNFCKRNNIHTTGYGIESQGSFQINY